MVRTGDVGYYRVNPPLHKLLSGVPVDWSYHPRLSQLHYAWLMPSGVRYHEPSMGVALIRDNVDQYRRLFILGRLVRIPIILLAGCLLAVGLPRSLRHAGKIAAILWFTSPLVLGHGWLIMPDAVSGVAAAMLLVTSLRWLVAPSPTCAVMTGAVWGAAISTKFTFCPLLLLWPVAVVVYRMFLWQGFAEIRLVIVGLLLQATTALVIVIAVYGGSQVGVAVGKHDFRSKKLEWLNSPPERVPIGDLGFRGGIVSTLQRVPSPLPKQFTIGIDEQQIDLEKGYPTYLFGTWYYGNAWWWIFPAYALKEQTVVWLGVFLFLPALTVEATRRLRSRQSKSPARRHRMATMVFCLFSAGSVFLILALNGKMALNVRYVFPALPMLYLAVGIAVITVFPQRRTLRWSTLVVLAAGCIEAAMVTPHHFAYVNPLAGGMYRIPAALNASNFDGSQDLWRLERWANERPCTDERLYTCIHSNVPADCIELPIRLPSADLLRHVIRSQHTPRAETPTGGVTIVLMRGIVAPAPWNLLIGGRSDEEYRALLLKLAMCHPDEFLSPTIAVYRATTPHDER